MIDALSDIMARPSSGSAGGATIAASVPIRRCVSQTSRKVKAILVEEAGGCCRLCGYDRNMRALQFHHLDPAQKRHEINAKGVALALDKLRVGGAQVRASVL